MVGTLFAEQLQQNRMSRPPDAVSLTPQNLSAETVAALPPPGLTGPTSIAFSPKTSPSSPTYLAFLSSSSSLSSFADHATTATAAAAKSRRHSHDRQLCVCSTLDFNNIQPLLRIPTTGPDTTSTSAAADDSLEEKLRRERQRLHSSGTGVTQFTWIASSPAGHFSPPQQQQQQSPLSSSSVVTILVPVKGSLHVQHGISPNASLEMVYDKNAFASHINSTTTNNNSNNNMNKNGSVVGRDASAIDAQLSPDGKMVAFVVAGEIYVTSSSSSSSSKPNSNNTPPLRITYGAVQNGETSVTHGLADFVAQEEMDRYRGFWWHPNSMGILFARVDESHVPPYRINHQSGGSGGGGAHHQGGGDGNVSYEDHRYPFAGQANPNVQLGFVRIDPSSILVEDQHDAMQDAHEVARERWGNVTWIASPREASEYLARITWLPDGSPCAQWQNRTQSTLVLAKLDLTAGNKTRTLLVERSELWINLHHMCKVLPRAVHPDECADAIEKICPPGSPLPEGSFSFLFASERTGFCHLYLYTYCPGLNSDRAILVRAVSGGEWVLEGIVGVDMDADAVYVTGTYDSSLERHLYALPIVACPVEENGLDNQNGSGGMRRSLKNVMSALSGTKSGRPRDYGGDACHPIPIRLTADSGMHSIVMDEDCRLFVDTSSDLGRPTTVKVYKLPTGGPFSVSNPSTAKGRKISRRLVEDGDVRLVCSLYDASTDDRSSNSLSELSGERLLQLPSPELISFPSSDGTETLHAAVYRPDPRIHGPGPYPLICAVYGGPHVQRVNRSWSQCCDMRAQRLRSLGFAVVKCDNRGSSRRGLAFEGAIRGRLGRLEVLDQVAAVRHLIVRGVADSSRVGIYGWSYGGYLAAMCLLRAPDVFHVAVAGAPVTSWDGYDTHYTERYMGLPADNASGYREASLFDHVPNMRGKLMIVHGLIDENVHFRHTARLINRLIANGKDYDLLIFPDERHSPRRLRDRIYLEQRISDYFSQFLLPHQAAAQQQQQQSRQGPPPSMASTGLRPMAGHL